VHEAGESEILREQLASPVDQSLLRHDTTGPEARFSMLETIRDYAYDGLRAAGGSRRARAAARGFREIGHKRSTAMLLHNLGQVAHRRTDLARASQLFADTLTQYDEMGDKRGTGERPAGLAGVTASEGRPQVAALLFGAAQAVFEATGYNLYFADRDEFETNTAAARAQLDRAEWDTAWHRGYSMPLEQAVAYALSLRAR
jgi:hypothetical protein